MTSPEQAREILRDFTHPHDWWDYLHIDGGPEHLHDTLTAILTDYLRLVDGEDD